MHDIGMKMREAFWIDSQSILWCIFLTADFMYIEHQN